MIFIRRTKIFNIEEVPILILAGGRGTRLKSEVSDRAKPMADINGKPFMDLILDKHQNRNIYISVGYMADSIINHYKDKYKYIIEKEPLGTGGAIKKAFEEINTDYLIVLNGDTFTNFEIPNEEPNNLVVLNTLYQENCSRYGHVDLVEGKVIFSEKGYDKEGYINSGVYLINRKAITNQPMIFSFEEFLTTFKNIKIIKHKSDFIDIGVPSDYKKAIKLFG